MSETITIQGFDFTVPAPYEAGHPLTDNEASALNGLLHENLRNNFASKVKKAVEAAGEDGTPDLAALQTELDEYAAGYSFNLRRAGGGGGVKRDPVSNEAFKLAKDAIYAALKAKGKARKDYTNEQISEAAEKLLASPSGAAIRTAAEERVKAAQSVAQVSLDGLAA